MDPLARLCSLRTKEVRLALGLMSGMSGDGLDLALVRVEGAGERPRAVRLLAAKTDAYPEAFRERLRAAQSAAPLEVAALGQDLAERWAASVTSFLREAAVAARDVDVVGSHGQTLAHRGREDGRPARTLQVGDGDLLAERTGLLVVSDLRARDVAAGGEGAPLVPMADWLLWSRPGEVVASQNLGSIGNVTVVAERAEDVQAFDTGPANALLDAFARGAGQPMDRDGLLSARGRLDPAVLAFLEERSRAFLDRPPPRSAGYEDFGPPLARAVRETFPHARPEDLVRTAVAFTASTTAGAYARHVLPRFPMLRRVRLSGGGVRNPSLLAALRETLATLGLEAEPLEEAWIDAKEAIAFALLADRTARGLPGNLPSATGARRAVVLGKLSLPGSVGAGG